ncbi:MAG TPA: hypothetical protein DEP45_11800 [Armatimonadetes bacterium]|nr:hypothetical protein [Armatimonadota bacterium]
MRPVGTLGRLQRAFAQPPGLVRIAEVLQTQERDRLHYSGLREEAGEHVVGVRVPQSALHEDEDRVVCERRI